MHGDLEILLLDFHSIGLPLEKTAGGVNNFTFGESGQPAILPTIARLSLHDAAIACTGTVPVNR